MTDNNRPDDDLMEEKGMDRTKPCEKIVHQKAKVTLPISIEPFVVSGKIKTRCCGAPKLSIAPYCECKDYCNYLITQEICIEIPLKFGAITETKETFIECEEPVIEDGCRD